MGNTIEEIVSQGGYEKWLFRCPLGLLYYYNAPSLATRLTGNYHDRTYTNTRKRKAMACAMTFFLSSACRYTYKFNGNIICRCIIFNCFTIDAVSISAFHPNIYMNNCSVVVYFFGDFYYNFTGCTTNSFTFFLSNCLLK